MTGRAMSRRVRCADLDRSRGQVEFRPAHGLAVAEFLECAAHALGIADRRDLDLPGHDLFLRLLDRILDVAWGTSSPSSSSLTPPFCTFSV